VWFRAKLYYPAADFAAPAIAVIEPTKDYFLPVATLAGEFEKELVELADSHDDSPTIRECQKAIYRQFQIARSGPKFE
jgi:hypothetical protein